VKPKYVMGENIYLNTLSPSLAKNSNVFWWIKSFLGKRKHFESFKRF